MSDKSEKRMKRCRKCQYSRGIGTMTRPFFRLLVCHGGEYKGKWVIEIDKCPLEISTESEG